MTTPFSFSADFQRVCESQLEVEKSSRQRGRLDRPPSQHVDVLAEVSTITIIVTIIVITIIVTITIGRCRPTGSKAYGVQLGLDNFVKIWRQFLRVQFGRAYLTLGIARSLSPKSHRVTHFSLFIDRWR